MASHLSIFLPNMGFRDVDEFAETTRAWNLDFHQTEPGPFEANLQQIGTGRVQFSGARFTQSLSQVGEPPKGYHTIVIPAENTTEFSWRCRTVSNRDIAIFPFGSELEAGSRTGFHIYTVSIEPEFLEDLATAMDLPAVLKTVQRTEVVTPAPSKLRSLRWVLERYSHLVKTKSSDKALVDLLECELPRQVLRTLAASSAGLGGQKPRQRDRAFRRVRDLLREYPDEVWTMGQLCKVAGISERTLQYAFSERFGVTPQRYMKTLRLARVRRTLKASDPTLTTVAEVANYWGFWHMGQFGVDYRRFFGEIPSQTLKRTPHLS